MDCFAGLVLGVAIGLRYGVVVIYYTVFLFRAAIGLRSYDMM